MPSPATIDELLDLIRKSGLVESQQLDLFLDSLRQAGEVPETPKDIARLLVRDAFLTYFQAGQLLQGKWRGFTVGKYRLLEWLGSGGMGYVYLAEHIFMRRRVAIKVLPLALATDTWFLDSFYREAQAVAALDHPNIVRAHDIDHEGNLHFLVMEYVDGSSLQKIVAKHGPMDCTRAAHYIRQAALGLQHAHERGLIHRDIKPGNLLLDRQGIVKILDMGLACFSRSQQGPASNPDDKRMVGTDDYLAPEQVVDSDDVDTRADLYGLGGTFYFLLTCRSPFEEAVNAHHKLIWHLTRRPKPVREFRPEVPEGLCAVVEKMMAKNPWDRYQTPTEVALALADWAKGSIPPPPEHEMPHLSPAVQRQGLASTQPLSAVRSSVRGRSWVVFGGTQGSGPPSNPLSAPSHTQAHVPTGTAPATQPHTPSGQQATAAEATKDSPV
jgi:serine/threonine protein kinase